MAGRIADEVIAHLAALPGAGIEVTLEVHEHFPDLRKATRPLGVEIRRCERCSGAIGERCEDPGSVCGLPEASLLREVGRLTMCPLAVRLFLGLRDEW